MPGGWLTCYTANLHAYLGGEWDADAVIARSIRLAARRLEDGIAFSHHRVPLNVLADGSVLAATGSESPEAALAGVAGELERHGRALVVTDAARLPWSVAFEVASAPHWLLVDGERNGQWHVVDRFAGLLEEGDQEPYEGWIDSRTLRGTLTLPPRWHPHQEVRNMLAFGLPTLVPAAPAMWFRRTRSSGRPAYDLAPLPREGWAMTDGDVFELVAGALADDRLVDRHAALLEDVWAAAGHRCFAHARKASRSSSTAERAAIELAIASWARLPRLLRMTAISVSRGRPRPTLARAALDEVERAEEAIAA